MRWRGREGPWGSHQEEARAEKWEISVSLTEEEVEGLWRVGGVVVKCRVGGCWWCCDVLLVVLLVVVVVIVVAHRVDWAARRADGICRNGGRILTLLVV